MTVGRTVIATINGGYLIGAKRIEAGGGGSGSGPDGVLSQLGEPRLRPRAGGGSSGGCGGGGV